MFVNTSSFPRLYSRNLGLTYIVFFCQHRLFFVGYFYFRNIIFGKFCRMIVKSIPMSSFCRAILSVVFFCANTKMLRINTWRIVARVKDNHPVWNFPKNPFIHKPMCSYWGFFWQKKYAVSIFISSARPFPASVWHFNIPIIKNIVHPKDWIIMKASKPFHFIIMTFAKLSTYRWRVAKQTFNYFSCGIAHNSISKVINKVVLYTTTTEYANA